MLKISGKSNFPNINPVFTDKVSKFKLVGCSPNGIPLIPSHDTAYNHHLLYPGNSNIWR